MKLLCYTDYDDQEAYVNIEDISAIVTLAEGGSAIYLQSDISVELGAKYSPAVVVQGEVVEL